MRNVRRKWLLLTAAVLSTLTVAAATNIVTQCWAVTKSGNRCKRRAVSGERYCRQHSAARVPAKSPSRCRSMTTNGVQCASAPIPGSNYCRDHGCP